MKLKELLKYYWVKEDEVILMGNSYNEKITISDAIEIYGELEIIAFAAEDDGVLTVFTKD